MSGGNSQIAGRISMPRASDRLVTSVAAGGPDISRPRGAHRPPGGDELKAGASIVRSGYRADNAPPPCGRDIAFGFVEEAGTCAPDFAIERQSGGELSRKNCR